MATDFLSKAHDTLLAAQVLLEKELYDSCANRAYYAAFQAALAALTSFGLKAEKSEHKWVQATFNSELLHKRKLFDGRFKTYLT